MKTKLVIAVASALISLPAFAQEMEEVIYLSWCENSKIINQYGLVRDCKATLETPKCTESTRPYGAQIIYSATCTRPTVSN